MPDTPQLVTSIQVCEILGCARSDLARLIATRAFPEASPDGTSRRWHLTEVLGWYLSNIESHRRRSAFVPDQGVLSEILTEATHQAESLGHQMITLDHLWLALTSTQVPGHTPRILESVGMTQSELASKIDQSYGNYSSERPLSVSRITSPVNEAFSRSREIATRLRDDLVGSEHLLLSLLALPAGLSVVSLALDPATGIAVLRARTEWSLDRPNIVATFARVDVKENRASPPYDFEIANNELGIHPSQALPWHFESGLYERDTFAEYLVDATGDPIRTADRHLVDVEPLSGRLRALAH